MSLSKGSATRPDAVSRRHVVGSTQHLFKVGQRVRINAASFALKRSTYSIVALLPSEGRAKQYRIRNAAEPHDRIMTEPQLEAVADAPVLETAAPVPHQGESLWPRAKSVAIAKLRNPRKRNP